jgi:hypothetical protein
MGVKSFVETELQVTILRKIFYILADFPSVLATNLMTMIKDIFK